MSLKSAYVIYRVDGVSGLNVFTGINQSQFPSQQLGERSHQSCSQRGSQLSVPQVMLSVPQSWVKRSAQYNKANSLCNSFFQKSLSLTRLSQRECPTMPPDTGVTHPFQKGKTTPRLRGPLLRIQGKGLHSGNFQHVPAEAAKAIVAGNLTNLMVSSTFMWTIRVNRLPAR